MRTKLPLALVAAAAIVPSETGAKSNEKQPNILLIMCDDLIDFDGIYRDHPYAQTPNLDRLKRESVCFSNAHTSAPLSGPSRASLFTGVSPNVSRNYGTALWYENATLSGNHTIMSQLKESGYQTYGTGKLLHDNRRTEFTEFGDLGGYGPTVHHDDGGVGHPSVPKEISSLGTLDGTFASLADDPAQYGDKSLYWSLNGKRFRYVSEEDRDEMGDERVARWASEKLAEIAQQEDAMPFFLGVGFYRPHTPLVVPQKYFDRVPLESIKLPEWIENDTNDTYLHEVASKTRGYQVYKAMREAYGDDMREGFRKYIQAYLASINFADEQVGKVLDALEKSGLSENTVVIFTSDHGYDFGQKEYIFKNSLWTTSTQVPFLVRTPKAMGGHKVASKVCTAPISLVDIYPTIIDYTGVTSDNRRADNGAPLSGGSIRMLVENPKQKVREGYPVALTSVRGGKDVDALAQHYAVKGERWRYIRYSNGREELYDCLEDPREITNLAAITRYSEVKSEMYSEMKRLVPEL